MPPRSRGVLFLPCALGKGCECRICGHGTRAHVFARAQCRTREYRAMAGGSIASWRPSCSRRSSTTVSCGSTSITRCIIHSRTTRNPTRTNHTANRNSTSFRRGAARSSGFYRAADDRGLGHLLSRRAALVDEDLPAGLCPASHRAPQPGGTQCCWRFTPQRYCALLFAAPYYAVNLTSASAILLGFALPFMVFEIHDGFALYVQHTDPRIRLVQGRCRSQCRRTYRASIRASCGAATDGMVLPRHVLASRPPPASQDTLLPRVRGAKITSMRASAPPQW